MHFTVQRNTEYFEPVRSKDPLVLLLGPRRFLINPIFSQHTVRGGGKGANNVHKFERFLRHGIQAQIATAYLPITFGAQPAVLLRVPSSAEDSMIHLVGTGTLLSSDPTRITAKRLILTGHPFKVHKKTATIRYMFFNQLDIDYYKPVQLRTKRGRTGHIRESLGTHGYFKAGFDGPIDQMDQICLTLYKRCFPKWSKVRSCCFFPRVRADSTLGRAGMGWRVGRRAQDSRDRGGDGGGCRDGVELVFTSLVSGRRGVLPACGARRRVFGTAPAASFRALVMGLRPTPARCFRLPAAAKSIEATCLPESETRRTFSRRGICSGTQARSPKLRTKPLLAHHLESLAAAVIIQGT